MSVKAAQMPPKRDPNKEVPDTVPVKLNRELHRKIRVIVAHTDREIYAYLDEVLRPIVERDYQKVTREARP